MPEPTDDPQQLLADVDPVLREAALGVGRIFNGLDEQAARAFIHPDYVDHEASEGVGGGPEGYLATARYMNSAFSGASWVPEQIVSGGDRFAVALTFSGIHTGDFLGIPATGRRVRVRHMHIFRVKGGMVVEHWGARDELTLLQQIGVIETTQPTPADAGAARG